MEKSYECRTCKKLCVGFRATYRNQCMQCRVLEMRIIYERERLGILGKRELEIEHRRLQKKLKKTDEYAMCDDDISQSEKSSDTGYVAETPVKKRVSSLTQRSHKRKTQRKNRKKDQSQLSERDNSSEEQSEQESSGEEESVFFLSRKEREELAKKEMKGESEKRKMKKQKVVEHEQEREEREREADSEDTEGEEERGECEGKADSEDREGEKEREEREGKADSQNREGETEREEREGKADLEERR